jgi:hypothetical protein
LDRVDPTIRAMSVWARRENPSNEDILSGREYGTRFYTWTEATDWRLKRSSIKLSSIGTIFSNRSDMQSRASSARTMTLREVRTEFIRRAFSRPI